MTRRVIVHVGQMKSGTTFMQQTLAQNRESLLRSGISYPGPKYNQQHACYGLCGNDIYWVHDQERWEHAGDALLDSIRASDETVVISSEALSCMPQSGVDRFAERIGGIDTVVVTVRNMLSTLLSAWQQGVKRGSEASLAEFFARMHDERDTGSGLWRNYAFGNTVDRWTHHADVSVVVVDSFDRDELMDAFLRAARIDDVELAAPELSAKDRNVSLRWEDAELLRSVNRTTNARRRPDADEFRGFLLEHLLFPAAQSGLGSRIKFPEEHIEKSVGWAREEIAKFPPGTTVLGDVDALASSETVASTPDADSSVDLVERTEELLFDWFRRHVLPAEPN
ncbi:MAG: hypothetical protein R8G01_23325 [Ilumatobacteraceae bacterium]|nr:hypothetical protein [Ilumatobacteraceae bacterium]